MQTKFLVHLSPSPGQPSPQPGLKVEATAMVLLNALGYIGFKVISTCGDKKVGSVLLLRLSRYFNVQA